MPFLNTQIVKIAKRDFNFRNWKKRWLKKDRNLPHCNFWWRHISFKAIWCWQVVAHPAYTKLPLQKCVTLSLAEPILLCKLDLFRHKKNSIQYNRYQATLKKSKLPSVCFECECFCLLFVTWLWPSLISPCPLLSLALLPTALVVSDDLSPEPGRLDDLDHDEGIEDENGKVGNQLSQNKLKSQI